MAGTSAFTGHYHLAQQKGLTKLKSGTNFTQSDQPYFTIIDWKDKDHTYSLP